VPSADIETLRGSVAPTSPVLPIDPEAIKKMNSVSAGIVELRGVSAGYKKRPAVLRDLTIKLTPGRVYLLLGPNGAGKSTCAKVLCGVLKPIAGDILLNGEIARPWKSPGKTVGYHLQNPDVGLFESTVLAELGGKERAQILLDAFGLRGAANANPLSLPFPVRKRVSLAATIGCSQPWLFLDEPTLGADAATIELLAKISMELAAKGHGVIVVSHSSRFRSMLDGTHLLLDDGKIQPVTETAERA
jgi:ABC-type multidrug transport system ATPase subunit